MAYKAVSKAEAKRFIHEVRKAHDVIIDRTYARKDTVTAAVNGLTPKLPDDENKFFNGKGEWIIPPNDVYTLQMASPGNLGGVKVANNTGITIGSTGIISIVPASSSVIGGIQFPNNNVQNLYLRGDGTWTIPPDTKYTLPVATRDSLGGVIVGDNISVSSSGKIGVSVPGNTNTYLRGDGTWTIPPDTKYSTVSTSQSGLVPTLPTGNNAASKFLNGQGEWTIPPDTKYTLPVATRDSLGGVIVGDNISVSSSGKIGVSVPGNTNTYLRGDGTWTAPTAGNDYKGPINILVSENRNTLAQSIATNGITSTILQTLVPNLTSIGNPSEGDKYLVTNTDSLLDIYAGDYIIYQDDTWRYIKSSGLRSKSLSFKGYISSSQDLEQIAAADNDSLSSSSTQSNNSSIGDMWLMKTTLGFLEQGDLLLRTGSGDTDWKVIHENPTTSSTGGGIDFTAGRGLDLSSENVLDVNFNNETIPAMDAVFNMGSYSFAIKSSAKANTDFNGRYIYISTTGFSSNDVAFIHIGFKTSLVDYTYEEEIADDYYYHEGSGNDYYYHEGSGVDYYY